jgi:A/G-specific adenine glycosylase
MHPIASILLEWYDREKRSLPWRDLVTPYRTWLSEVMLQQTRVETVRPYFHRFLAHYPLISDLAEADEAEVLSLWSGLGYYSRARSLHKAAQIVAAAGKFPDTARDLQKLPGVGPYIAGAIASIAFGRDEAAVDGNHHRVFSRLFCDPGERKSMWAHGRRLLPAGRAGDFNQALMDLGSSLCLPKRPKCSACPIAKHCEAHQKGEVQSYPKKSKKKVRPVRVMLCALVRGAEGVLVARRPSRGLYGGLYELPSFFSDSKEFKLELEKRWSGEFGTSCSQVKEVGSAKHILTHMEVQAHLYTLEAPYPVEMHFYQDLKWIQTWEKAPISSLSKKLFRLAGSDAQLSLFGGGSR